MITVCASDVWVMAIFQSANLKKRKEKKLSLRKILGIKKKFTEEELENKSLVTLLREGMEEEGYGVTVYRNGRQIYPKTLSVEK